ncbi:response regulator [Actinokineospora sp. NPDC004072]
MITVLVVEDNPIAAEAHRTYVSRVPGFTPSGVAHSARAALRFLETTPVDLVLLDLYLPDTHGLDLLRTLRATAVPADVIAVTSARDLAVVRSAVSAGVVQYLLKPFTFPALRAKLTAYAHYRTRLSTTTTVNQSEVDSALEALRAPTALPKGMSPQTLTTITTALHTAGELTATTAAEATGVSRPTARRYLEYLATHAQATRHPHYGPVGRPELHYRPTPPR